MIRTGPASGPILIFGHGAGAGMNSQFLEAFTTKLSERSIACVRFEFPYMEKYRSDGRRRPPDRMPKLEERFSEIYAAVDGNAVLIGGKSMGGAGRFSYSRSIKSGRTYLCRLPISSAWKARKYSNKPFTEPQYTLTYSAG